MFNFFKKKKEPVVENIPNVEIELTASLLAYEIARGDGDVSDSELSIILNEIKKITSRV